MDTSSPTSNIVGTESPVWYRSLYWRIGLGFVLFLVLVVAIQAGALVWLTSRVEYGPPSPSATRVVAEELSLALAADPKLDLAQFFKQHYEEHVPMVAVMRDGRVVSSDGAVAPTELIAAVQERLSSPNMGPFGRMPGIGPDADRGDGRAPWEGRGPDGAGRGGPDSGGGGFRGFGPGPGGRVPRWVGGPLRRGSTWSPVVVENQLVGGVLSNPRSPWEQFGPALLVIGLALVAVGTTSAALLIFGPVRRRLRSLEQAAKHVGAGNLNARAREDGRDEVAALAHAFNQMTSDLSVRAEQLQSADRQRRLLLADVSHELMTPLTAMRGYLETLSMSGLTINDETRSRYLSIVDDETRRMELIVGDLLEMARLEGSHESFDAQDVPVEDLFGRVRARHEREAEQKGVALTTSVGPGAEIVAGDPMKLEQALQNLAANALRHTPTGGQVGLGAELRDRDVVIVVRDTGSGISPEHLPRVFDRFYKVDPSRSGGQAGGSGLGLSIVKAIVERHGGTIAVSSVPGRGTEFTIRLPLA